MTEPFVFEKKKTNNNKYKDTGRAWIIWLLKTFHPFETEENEEFPVSRDKSSNLCSKN